MSLQTPAVDPTQSSLSRVLKPVPWRGVKAEFHQVPAYEALDYVPSYYAIDVNLGYSYHLEWKHNGRFRRTWMAPGALCIAPAHESVSMRWASYLEIVSVHLDPSWLTRTSQDLKIRGEVEIPEQHGEFDPQIAHLCHALWAESKAGYPTGRLFGESLASALSSCLLQRHGVRRTLEPREGKLSARQWERLRDYIEDNLDEDISLETLAALVHLSVYHFSRCFKATCGSSPHQYVITRRIERARQLLSRSRLPLAQVALQCGFSDQSHLTRHMKRLLGVTPAVLLAQYENKSKNIQ